MWIGGEEETVTSHTFFIVKKRKKVGVSVKNDRFEVSYILKRKSPNRKVGTFLYLTKK